MPAPANIKIVFIVRGGVLFKFPIREAKDSWIVEGDCPPVWRKRFSKKDRDPFPWDDTPEAALLRAIEQRKATVEKVEAELARCKERVAQAEGLKLGFEKNEIKIDDRTVIRPLPVITEGMI